MDAQINALVAKTWQTYQTLPPTQRLLLAVSGVPGSGKTTIANVFVARLNTLHQSQTFPAYPVAACISLDGYHLPRSVLSSLPNSAEAHARRGAPFTFDSLSYLALVQALRAPLSPGTPIICAPSFDHAIKDPVENAIAIAPTIRICVFEGNYLSLDWGVWRDAGDAMDEHVFVSVERAVAEERLARRHIASGICAGMEEARARARGSDRVNADVILGGRREDVGVVLVSVEEGMGAERLAETERIIG